MGETNKRIQNAPSQVNDSRRVCKNSTAVQRGRRHSPYVGVYGRQPSCNLDKTGKKEPETSTYRRPIQTTQTPLPGRMTREELLICQKERWNRMTENWARASNNSRCICVGDINLDYTRWDNPLPSQASMVKKVKDIIVTKGFSQVICGATRFWNNQRDSLLDQIWLNCRED